MRRPHWLPSSIAACAAVAGAIALLPSSAQAGFSGSQALSDPVQQIGTTADAVDSAGNTWAVWDEVNGSGPTLTDDVKARRIAADGTLGTTLPISTPGEISFQPSIAMGPDGRVFVAWATIGQPNGVEGRWINTDGSLGPIDTLLTPSATEDATAVTAVVGDEGVASVIWFNQSQKGGKLEARQVGPDDSLGPQLTGPAGQSEFAAAALPGGSTFIVVGAMTTVLSANGTFSTPVNASTSNGVSTLHTGIAFDAHGDGLIAWRKGNGPPDSIVARRIDETGAPIGDEIVVDPQTTDSIGPDQEVGVDSSGHFLVGWFHQDVVNDGHAFVRAVNLDGSLPGDAHPVSALGNATPLLTLDDLGTGVASFVFRDPGAMQDLVQGQALDIGGSPAGPNAALSGGNVGFFASLASNPANGVATTVWNQVVGDSSVATFSRFLEPLTCANATATVVQGRPVAASVSCNGIDFTGARVVSGPAHGKLGAFDPATHSFTYTPTAGFEGSDSFVYEGDNDGGPSAGATVRIGVGRDTVPPAIQGFALKRTRMHAAHVVAGGKHKKKRAATFSYTFELRYSEASTVKLTIQQPRRGVRKGKHCRPAHGAARGKACTLYRSLGSLSSSSVAGSASIAVPATLVRRLAKAGKLRVTAIAFDAAHNPSQPRHLNLRFTSAGT